MNLLEKLIENLTENQRKKDSINIYSLLARKFLEKFSEISEENIKKYQKFLAEKGYSQSYLRLNHYVLKKLAKLEGKDIDIRPPQLQERPQPVFTFEEVKNLILNAKEKCPLQIKAFLAVSTVWGLRRIEIVSIGPEDIDRRKHTIFIKTAKKGRPQVYTIPPQIRDIIYSYDWSQKISKSRASLIFMYMLYLCGFDMEKYKGYGYHSIRRALITELINSEIDNFTVALFLRWRINAFGLLPTYTYTPMPKIEKLVYPKHPFLKFW